MDQKTNWRLKTLPLILKLMENCEELFNGRLLARKNENCRIMTFLGFISNLIRECHAMETPHPATTTRLGGLHGNIKL